MNVACRFLWLCLCAAFALGALAAPVRAAEPYEIDAILSLTGSIALIGTDQAVALTALEKIINRSGGIHGRPVHFVVQDDQSQPSVAVQLASAIIAKHPAVMIGPTYAGSCLAVAPLVRANGPVMYCFAPAIHPPAGGYMFSAGTSSLDQATAMVNFAISKGWKKIAAIATTDASGVDLEGQLAVAIDRAKSHGVSLVDVEHFAPADVSIAAQCARLKTVAPDLIVITSVGTPVGTALVSMKDAGLQNVPVITNFGNLLHGELKGFASATPREMYITAPRFAMRDVSRSGPVRDAQLQFYDAFKAVGVDPDAAHNLPWDPTLILIDALRHVGPNATPKQVLDYLEPLHGYAGTDGIFDFRDGSQRGVGVNAVAVVRWNPAAGTWATVSGLAGMPLQH
jgi:branched-chain amino acid transport system substrate-binding protein